MSFTHALRRALPKIDVVPAISEHRLAAASQRLQERDGFVYGARFKEHTSYLPYYAARPIAPHVDGWRTAGFGGAALWGASVAVSLVRNELPSLTLYYHTYLSSPVRLATNPPDRSREKSGWEELKPYLPYAPLALSAWELLFGTGSNAAPAHAGPNERSWYERLRGPGLIGKASAGLAHVAERQDNSAAQGALLSAACLISLVNQVPRAIGAVVTGLVAGAGAAFGIAYEMGVRIAVRACGENQRTSMQDAQAMQAREMRERMRALNDEVLPAPLVTALWNGRTAFEPNTNYWSNLTQGAADLFEHTRDPRLAVFLNLRGNPRPTRWRQAPAREAHAGRRQQGPAQRGGVPLARDMGNGRQNVHAVGRDAATRHSLGTLLTADPLRRADVDAAYADLLDFIGQLARSGEPFAARRHPAGSTICAAASCALTGEGPRNVPQYYPPIVSTRSTYNVDGHGIVPMKTIAALVWRAIGRLHAVDGRPENTAALVRERKEAFVAALASSLDDQGTLLCQGGQSQRMVLVLQGFAPGIQIEAYDAPAPVAQFVTFVTERMNRDLTAHGEPDAAAVQRAYDAAYLEGCALYQGDQREALRQQLCAVAQALYEVDWTHAAA